MAGCSGSKTIIAVNRDPDANIFNSSRWGIVGDYKEVVPALIEALKS
jgi:electron transfer flavoprotein alpha subunit